MATFCYGSFLLVSPVVDLVASHSRLDTKALHLSSTKPEFAASSKLSSVIDIASIIQQEILKFNFGGLFLTS